jgi:2',3'-cyclic-nucleotide 2'-phosphodiesterase/3'-nucleotidase
MNHAAKQTITILQTSDIHGFMLPIQYANNEPTANGFAKIAALIKLERSINDNILLIDNGDLIQGTPLAYHHARLNASTENPMIRCLNELRYDAAVIGNHEFNYGLPLLQKAIHESAFPWLCANIVDAESGEPFFGTPYLLRSFERGPTIAVLGLTTDFIPNWENPDHIVGLSFQPVLAVARKWVAYLREEKKADVVIVSYHGGFERDLETGEPTEPLTGENVGYALCREVEGIDVLLTGHQHRAIAGKAIHGVTVVQPGSQGAYLGKVRLDLEYTASGWQISEASSELLSAAGAEEAVAEIVDILQPHEALTQEWLDQPIGKLLGDMRVTDPMALRLKEHPLIEFINRVQMELTGATISNTALFDNIAPGFPPDITMRDIVSNYIYPNTLQVIRISGQDIKDALEHSASYFAEYDGGPVRVSPAFSEPKPQHYNYDMWEGIEYKLNISRPVGERVKYIHYEGKPIEPQGQYDVVMNNYRAAGGGNYTMFQGKPLVKDIPTDMAELLASYIMDKGTIEAALNSNWEVVWD